MRYNKNIKSKEEITMNFRKFYDKSTFTLYARSSYNWDIYVMHTPGYSPCLVSLAKPGSGAADSFFGPMDWLDQLERRGIEYDCVKVAA
jgi:hypothetical protein